jgi:SAM-dependent methyltransferase
MSLLATDDHNADQVAYWNGPVGERWRNRQPDQDVLLAPISDLLLRRAAPLAGEVVLDVGCGCGYTTIELARRVAPKGRVLGVDISAPMLERASLSSRRMPPPMPSSAAQPTCSFRGSV